MVASRRVNWKLAGLLAVLVATAAGATYAVRQWQLGKSREALRVEAARLAAAGKRDEEVDLWERYVALFPNDPQGRSAYARALDATLTGPKGRTRVYLALEEALRRGADDPDLRRRIVETALAIGRTPDALVHLDLLKRAAPHDAWVAFHEGRARETLAEYAAAAEAYQKALDFDPDHVEAAERLARLLANRLDDPDRAARILDTLTSAHAASPQAWLARARHREERREWKGAAEDLERAERLAPGDAAIRLAAAGVALNRARDEQTRGSAAGAKAVLDAARAELARAIELAPKNVDVWLKAAEIEEAAGATEAAIRLLQRGIAELPRDVRLQARLADRLISDGKTADARSVIETIADTDTTRPLLGYLEGRLKMESRDWAAARDALDAAVRESAGIPELADHIALRLAECYRQLGNAQQEVATYRRVLRNSPGSEAARLGVAAAAARSGQPSEAIQEYRQLLNVPQVAVVLARLLLDRNARLPEPAREWKEIDQLLARAAANPESAAEAREIARFAAAMRGDKSALAPASRAAAKNTPPAEPRPDALLKELLAEIDRGDFDAAGRVWNNARRRLPAAAQVELNAGYASALMRHDKHDAAKEPLDLLRRSEPKSFRAAALLATWHAERGECQQAHRILESCFEQPEGDAAEIAARQAATAVLAGLLADRVAGVEAKRSPQAERQPANAAATSSDPCAGLKLVAVELCRKFVQRNPERLVPLAGFLGSPTALVHPLDVSPADWPAYLAELANDPSLIVVGCGRLGPAVVRRLEAAAAEAVRRDLLSGGPRIALGDFEGLLGRFDVAEKWYRSVLDVDPDHLLAKNNLAWLLALGKKSPQEALSLIEQAIKSWGPEPRLLDTRGCVCVALREPRKALADLEASLAARPGPVTALHLAQARLLAGDRAGASEALRLLLHEGVTADRLHPLERRGFENLQRDLAAELQAAATDAKP